MRSCAVRVLQAVLGSPKSGISGVLGCTNSGLTAARPQVLSILAAPDLTSGTCQVVKTSGLQSRSFGGFGDGHLQGSEQLQPGEVVTMHDRQRKSAMSGVVSYTSTESLAVDLLLARNEWQHPLALALRRSGMMLELGQQSLEEAGQVAESLVEEMQMDSVKRKRASKMNKHKHRKRRKRERMRK